MTIITPNHFHARAGRFLPLVGMGCMVTSPFVQIVAAGHGAGTVAHSLGYVAREGIRSTQTGAWYLLTAISSLIAFIALGWLAMVGRIPGGVRVVGTVSALGAWLTPMVLSEEWFLTGATGVLGLIATIIITSGFRIRASTPGSSCPSCGYPRPASGVAVCPECGTSYDQQCAP